MPSSSNPLLLSILIVFASAKILSEIFERLRLPGIVGEILAGILIGPGVLHWVSPSDTLKALSDIGVLFLLFVIGLDARVDELVDIGWTATAVAAMGELVPLVAIWAIILATGSTQRRALFVGASLVATSVGITASVLAARNLLQELASKVILTAAVIDDIFGLIVLAVATSVVQGRFNVLEIGLTILLAAVFTIGVAVWGTKVLRRFVPHFRRTARATEAEFHVAMVILFALAVLASYAGVAAIVGAFLAGMALADTADSHTRNLTSGVAEFLVPFFLVGIGLNFDVSAFRTPRLLFLALLVAAVAILAKLIGAAMGALKLGWQNALRVACGMVPRGEVAIIAAQLGLSLAILDSRAFSVIVFVVVLTALLTPMLLHFAFRPRL